MPDPAMLWLTAAELGSDDDYASKTSSAFPIMWAPSMLRGCSDKQAALYVTSSPMWEAGSQRGNYSYSR